jgi:hypothetical protein
VTEPAWKGLERRIARLFGAERRPSIGPAGYARGSDDDGSCPFALEVKRSVRYQLRAAWVEQARRNGRKTGRPWLLVMAQHHDRRPIAVVDAYWLSKVCRQAGLLPEVSGTAPGAVGFSAVTSAAQAAVVHAAEGEGDLVRRQGQL